MPETRVEIKHGSGGPKAHITTFHQGVNRNSWELDAGGELTHKTSLYYVCTALDALWRIFLGALAVYMIVIGAIYIHQCPIQNYIPMFMIVGGISLLPIMFLAVYMLKKDRVFEGLFKLLGAFFCSPILLFVIAWNIAGAVWVYGSGPTVDIYNSSSPLFCHPVLYISSAVAIAITFVILAALIYFSVIYFRRGVRRGARRN